MAMTMRAIAANVSTNSATKTHRRGSYERTRRSTLGRKGSRRIGRVGNPRTERAALPEIAQAWSLTPTHAEPWNALSLPTWAIHVSSLVEWLVAMGLVWEFSNATERPVWKSLTWGMLPLHASGICACTYHFFYNAPQLEVLVALQAFLTCVGNTTLCFAAYRISKALEEEEEEEIQPGSEPEPTKATGTRTHAYGTEAKESFQLPGFENLAEMWLEDSDLMFLGKLLAVSFAGAAAVKYGSLWIDAPFEPSLGLAMAMVFIPTGFNMLKWYERSSPRTEEPSE